MVWKHEKFKGDTAIYAFCPKCGFRHNPSKIDMKTLSSEIMFQWSYCPECGEYLYNESENVEVIWNERDISELYGGYISDEKL